MQVITSRCNLIFTLILITFGVNSSFLSAQTASTQEGCAPLEVNYTPPAGVSSYFWDFDNGVTSNLENPTNTFGTPGTYVVEFSENPGDPVIGTITIEVYPRPEMELDFSPAAVGCSPFNVTIEANPDLYPNVNATGYSWTFGDGNGDNGQTVNHTYGTGTYTVSVDLVTNLPSCNRTFMFSDTVHVVDPPVANFSTNPDPALACEAPLDVDFINNSTSDLDADYEWDFGNGNTSTDETPPTQTYVNDGDYEVTLTITNEYGCEDTYTSNVSIGSPTSSFEIPDTVCINQQVTPENTSSAGNYLWNFGSSASPQYSTNFEPTTTFTQEGTQTITLTTSSAGGNCSDDFQYEIYVEDPEVDLTANPIYSCEKITDVEFEGISSNNIESWSWEFGDDSTSTEQNPTHTYIIEDSTYTELGEHTFNVTLTVITAAGCVATQTTEIIIHPPWARFMPDVSEGCVPLEVTFSDSSRSNEDIISWHWDYDDGNTNTFTNNDDHTHTFTEVGEYEVTLTIENTAGCIDTSYAITILVGDEVDLDFDVSSTSVCPGEPIEFINLTEDSALISSWNYSSNGELLSHCADEDEPTLSFNNEVGMQSITLTGEYNGCYSSVTYDDLIEVRGPIAKFTHIQDCETPFEVTFINQSGDATDVDWDFGDGNSGTEANDPFIHTYASPGDYEVILTASNASSGCPDDTDTSTVYIRDLQAAFTPDELFCGGESYGFDASASSGVHEFCYRGYTWIYGDPNIRPYTTQDPTANLQFETSGDQTISLAVEDINGCKDTLTHDIVVYNLEVDYDISHEDICFPTEVDFTNLTVSDTNIVSYEWSFGDGNNSTVENPSHTYTSGFQTINTSLTITDEVGCQDTQSATINVYAPNSNISVSPGTQICLGEEITFTASDYTQQGSNLEFEWDFDDGTSGIDGNDIDYEYLESGQYEVTVYFTEIASGCEGETTIDVEVQDYPEAGFSTDVDDESVLCYPQIVNFQDTSVTTSQLTTIMWDMDTGNPIFDSIPTMTFDKGTYEIELIVSTSFGCADTARREIIVVGPEGDFEMDRNTICQGEAITFSLLDTVDVGHYVWEFGDGDTISNTNPVTHEYNFIPPSGTTTAQLIVYGFDGVCPVVIEKPVNIHQVIADFDRNDASDSDTLICVGESFTFINTSTDADDFDWDLGDSNFSTSGGTFNHTYGSSGTYEVTLMVENSTLGCRDTTMKEVIVVDPVQVIAIGDSVCYESTAQLDVENYDPDFTYSWSPQAELDDPNVHNPTLTATETNSFLVTAIDTNGCVSDDMAEVFVIPPIEEIHFDTLIVIGDSIILPANFPDEIDYYWDPETGLSCTDCSYPGVGPVLEDIVYTVYMEDIYGCFEGISTYTIQIIPETHVELPTTFTPNGDGVNDIIYVEGWGIKNLLKWEIYNRWGEMVFQTNDINQGWDGYHKGILQNNDVYVYVVKVETWMDEEIIKEGYINLMR